MITHKKAIMLNSVPKSSGEAFQTFEEIHRLIVGFIKEHKTQIKRGFAFTCDNSLDLFYMSLIELQEDPNLIGCNHEIRSQILREVGTYNFDTEYIHVVKVENKDPIRFIVQSGPLDEDGVEQIKSKADIQKIAAMNLKIGAAEHIATLRAKRKADKGRKPKKKR